MAEMSCLQIHGVNEAVLSHCNRSQDERQRQHLRDHSVTQILDSLHHWVQSDDVDRDVSENDFPYDSGYSGDVSLSDLILTAADGVDLLDRRSFVMDLFQQRVEQSQVCPLDDGISDYEDGESRSNSGFGVVQGNCDMRGDRLELDFGLELESGSGFVENIIGDSDLVVNVNDSDEHYEDDFFDATRNLELESCDVIVKSGSDSDDEDSEKEREIWGIDLSEEDVYVNEDGEDDEEDSSLTIPLCWDSLQFEESGENNEEWEEVLSVVAESDDSIPVSASVSATISLEDSAIDERRGYLGWEVLWNSRSLEFNLDDAERNMELYIGGIDQEYVEEDYLHTTEYEMLFEADISSGLGKPPASKSFIKNMKVFPLTKEDVMEKDNSMCCAVCKEEMYVGKEVAELPCRHKYHSECIVPWLGIRNTCPVCRFELPSDETEQAGFEDPEN